MPDEKLVPFIPIKKLREEYICGQSYDWHLPGTEQVKLNCPISVMSGQNDLYCSAKRQEEWREYTTDKYDYRLFGGDHSFLANRNRTQWDNAEYMAHMCDLIRADLQAVEEDESLYF